MTTSVFLVRHCEPNYDNHDDFSRELSKKGLQDRQFILDFFNGKIIDGIYSSPYKRSFDTVLPLAQKLTLDIMTIDDFKERKIDNVWIEDFDTFAQNQWSDFTYKLSDGESLQEVQDRNITALKSILEDSQEKSIVIGSHGTAISTIVNYFNPSFGYEEFNHIKSLMPFVIELQFKRLKCLSISLYNIFTGKSYEIYSL